MKKWIIFATVLCCSGTVLAADTTTPTSPASPDRPANGAVIDRTQDTQNTQETSRDRRERKRRASNQRQDERTTTPQDRPPGVDPTQENSPTSR